mmetsp:Transcript_8379/g.37759  ORF Transcript_8379/g.37759 Transcript_8379/m.37759 type:complete len:238 (+) Transcript_8379:332-1045(+)
MIPSAGGNRAGRRGRHRHPGGTLHQVHRVPLLLRAVVDDQVVLLTVAVLLDVAEVVAPVDDAAFANLVPGVGADLPGPASVVTAAARPVTAASLALGVVPGASRVQVGSVLLVAQLDGARHLDGSLARVVGLLQLDHLHPHRVAPPDGALQPLDLVLVRVLLRELQVVAHLVVGYQTVPPEPREGHEHAVRLHGLHGGAMRRVERRRIIRRSAPITAPSVTATPSVTAATSVHEPLH